MTIPPQASPRLPPTDPGRRRHRGEEEREAERRPPQDLSAEQSVLGSMLLCPDAIPVYLNSLEMTHTQVIQRLVAAEAPVPLHGIRDRTLNEEQEARRLRAIALAGVPPLAVDTSEEVTVPRLRSLLAPPAVPGTAPGRLLVDYLQLMTPETGQATSCTTEVDELARGLKILAKSFNIPVVVAAQLNRCVEQRADKKPAMADLRESGGIEANANAIHPAPPGGRLREGFSARRRGEPDRGQEPHGRHIHGDGRVPGPLLAFRRHHPQRHMTSPGSRLCGRILRRTADPGSLA
ncbi:DnaB-like helicase C-terminal domain-containing protein [Streptomyces sp. CBMA123]|uniref:DnaB-like helicase C-terminal domain-containing protein n=1 Tax=Streptomyces sp. CBMA123 TaxID=1896313 RepID=UPI001662018E|nr:DnaB-like helicase C-terminal domain-containing protein [Streptomyces sp. CBMA123]MBD0688824.1 hypothetical protein [Streptomyces sp. CBMA123]